MKSNHLPETAGAIVSVTGELEIDTELRDLQSIQVSLSSTNLTPDAEQSVMWYFSRPPSRRYVTIRIEKGGVNDGDIGTNPIDVSWTAFGR